MPVHPVAIFRSGDDLPACSAARDALRAAGFSIGPGSSRGSNGFLLGNRTVRPWPEMSSREQLALDGQMWPGRDGIVTIMLHADAPTEAVIAFQHVLACADQEHEPIDMRKAALQASLFAVAVAMFLPVVLAVLP